MDRDTLLSKWFSSRTIKNFQNDSLLLEKSPSTLNLKELRYVAITASDSKKTQIYQYIEKLNFIEDLLKFEKDDELKRLLEERYSNLTDRPPERSEIIEKSFRKVKLRFDNISTIWKYIILFFSLQTLIFLDYNLKFTDNLIVSATRVYGIWVMITGVLVCVDIFKTRKLKKSHFMAIILPIKLITYVIIITLLLTDSPVLYIGLIAFIVIPLVFPVIFEIIETAFHNLGVLPELNGFPPNLQDPQGLIFYFLVVALELLPILCIYLYGKIFGD